MTKKNAFDLGTRKIVDQTTGETTLTAVEAIARVSWLEQVEADDGLNGADVRFAIVLQSFVNREEGFAFCGERAVASKARVAERTARLRLERLKTRGHVLKQRRGRIPNALFLVLLDRQNSCRSKQRSDRQDYGRSNVCEDGVRPARNRCFDRQESSTSTGNIRFWNDAKSDGCEPITPENNPCEEPGAGAAARPRARAAAPSHGREVQGSHESEFPKSARPKARSSGPDEIPLRSSDAYSLQPDFPPLSPEDAAYFADGPDPDFPELGLDEPDDDLPMAEYVDADEDDIPF